MGRAVGRLKSDDLAYNDHETYRQIVCEQSPFGSECESKLSVTVHHVCILHKIPPRCQAHSFPSRCTHSAGNYSQGNAWSVNLVYASMYFERVFSTISAGRTGPGGVLLNLTSSR